MKVKKVAGDRLFRKGGYMDFTFLLDDKKMTIYECSKRSGIPYSTLSDIFKGRTPPEKMNFRTACLLAGSLGVSMENLYKQMHVPERVPFELFKSSACHRLKEYGDKGFICDVLSSGEIRTYYNWKWFPEAFYILALLDFVSRENNVPLCSDYDDIRKQKLPEPVFPLSVLSACCAMNNDEIKTSALREAVPEFLRHNIVESEVRNVI